MTDVETTLRTGLKDLGHEINPHVPPLAAVIARAERSPKHRRHSKRPLAVGLVGGVILFGSAAAATGIIPDSVTSVFDRFGTYDSPFAADMDNLELVASAPLADGSTIEYWMAPTKDGGRCESVSYTFPDGHRQESWVACTHDPNALSGQADLFAVTSFGGGNVSVAGHAPEAAASVLVSLSDGQQQQTVVQDNGFFVAAYPSTSSAPAPAVVNITAVGLDGDVLASRSYSSP